MAAKINISPPTYSQIENGRRGLKAERLQAIAKVLGITFGDLDTRVHGVAGKLVSRNAGTGNQNCGGKQDAV